MSRAKAPRGREDGAQDLQHLQEKSCRESGRCKEEDKNLREEEGKRKSKREREILERSRKEEKGTEKKEEEK